MSSNNPYSVFCCSSSACSDQIRGGGGRGSVSWHAFRQPNEGFYLHAAQVAESLCRNLIWMCLMCACKCQPGGRWVGMCSEAESRNCRRGREIGPCVKFNSGRSVPAGSASSSSAPASVLNYKDDGRLRLVASSLLSSETAVLRTPPTPLPMHPPTLC